MYPARFPRWAAQIVFEDGAAHFFDSPVDLFMFLDKPASFGSTRTAAEAAAMPSPTSATAPGFRSPGVFVRDSRGARPMRGPDLPAFADTRRSAGLHRRARRPRTGL